MFFVACVKKKKHVFFVTKMILKPVLEKRSLCEARQGLRVRQVGKAVAAKDCSVSTPPPDRPLVHQSTSPLVYQSFRVTILCFAGSQAFSLFPVCTLQGSYVRPSLCVTQCVASILLLVLAVF